MDSRVVIWVVYLGFGLVILSYLDLRCISGADTGRRQGYGILIDVFGSLGWVSLS